MQQFLAECGVYGPHSAHAVRQLLVACYLMGVCWWLGLALGNTNGWHEGLRGRQSRDASWLPLIALFWMVVPPFVLSIGRGMGWWEI